MANSRYRRFVVARTEARDGADGATVDVWAADSERPVRLSAADLALAQLHDGERDAATVLAAAAAQAAGAPTAARLEGFVAELTQHGLMRAGLDEPLPVPAHSDAELRGLGWLGGEPSFVGRAPHALPPSSLPGSRVNPGLTGGLTGLVTGRRGQANQIDKPLRAAPFIAIGKALLWPVASRWRLLGFVALFVLALSLLYAHRYQWLEMATGLFGSYRAILVSIACAALINLCSMSTRAAAIARYTPEQPRIGIVFGLLRIPRLLVDTAGAAERAPRIDRMRIVGAGLVGTAAPLALAIAGWLLFAQTIPSLALLCQGVTVIATLALLLRLNPLARYDGYFLLCNALDTMDLRDRAIGTLGGRGKRAWSVQTRQLPSRILFLYGAAIVLFYIALLVVLLWFVGGWLSERFQGIGFLALLSVMGVYMVKQYSRVSVERSTMGHVKQSWRPTRKQKLIAAVIAIICIFPYPYAPSGQFEVLPRNRADVRALVAGDVREVLVQEGELVKAGQVIARLEGSAQRAKAAASEADLARIEADLALVTKGARSEEIEVARSRVATAKAAADLTDGNLKRMAVAYRGKSVTAQEYERALGSAEVNKQQLIEAERQLELVSSPARDERLQGLQADQRRVQAELEFARQELAYTSVTAPIDGRVVSSRLQFARGTYLPRGELLALIEDTSELLAEIRLPESSIADIELEAEASIKPWAYPGSSFDGSVRAIAPAAEDGEYGKIVRVQVVLQDPDNRLKTGMTGNAKIDAGWHMTIVVFTKAIARFLFVELWSWIP